MEPSEKSFLEKTADLIPGLAGYRAPEGRRDTDERLREYAASRIDECREKVGQIRSAASEEGDVDMIEDLERLDARMQRTAGALRSAAYGGAGFFGQANVGEQELDRVYRYDEAILSDLLLLVRDVGNLKYEGIGNLTLREVEGTLASIELKVVNRKDIFETPAR